MERAGLGGCPVTSARPSGGGSEWPDAAPETHTAHSKGAVHNAATRVLCSRRQAPPMFRCRRSYWEKAAGSVLKTARTKAAAVLWRQPAPCRLVCSSAGTRAPPMHGRMRVQSVYRSVLCAPLPRLGWQNGKYLPSQLRDECSRKRRKEDKLRRENGEKGSGLLFGVKRVHSNRKEGSIGFAITPPLEMISRCLKLIGFLESAGGRKFWRGCDPCRPRGECCVTWEPGSLPVSITGAIHPRQTRQMWLPVGSVLRRRPSTPPPRGAEDASPPMLRRGVIDGSAPENPTETRTRVEKQIQSPRCPAQSTDTKTSLQPSVSSCGKDHSD